MKSQSRLTVDMPCEDHMLLKMACAKMGMTMKDFVLLAAFEKIEDFEDEFFAKKARDTLKKIYAGEEKTISWEAMKKQINK